MQEKNEKISGIMADDDKVGSNIDSMIKNLMVEIAKESVEDIRKQTLLSVAQKLELSNEDNHDIDKEITELETLIKRLQDEIVGMSETANKQLPLDPGSSVIEENSDSYNEASYVSHEKELESFPIISNDEDGMLEQQVKMFGENISNIIKASNNTNEQKDALDNVRRNFSELWNDPTKSSKSNLDLTEKPRETLSSKLSTAFNYCISSSLENNKLMQINNIPTESIKSGSNDIPIEQSEYVSEFCEGAYPNDGYTLNGNRDDDKKISADNKLPGDSVDNDDISGSVNEAVANNIINNVPILFNVENSYNLPDNIENDQRNETNTTDPKDTIISILKPETVEAAKITIMKTLQNMISSDNTGSPEPSQVIALPTDTPEIMQTQSVTRENTTPKADSIFKSFNRKIRKIVGRDSEKSISMENHKSEDLSDNDFEKELWKAFPRSKSEPSKNFYNSDDDSSIIELKNMIALSQDSPQNVIKDVSDTISTNNSIISNSETSNIKAAESSNEIINIVKTIIPKFAYDLIIDDTDKSKSANENPSDSTPITASLSTKSHPTSRNFFRIHLVENKTVVNSNNKEMPANTSNSSSTPQTPSDVSRKNPEADSTSITSSITAALPKFFGINLQTDQQQQNVMKTTDEQQANVMKTTDEQQANVMKAEVKTIQDVQENKVETDAAAEEDEDDDDDDETDEKEDVEDDDDNTYDVD